jgi:hypothetical protein
VIRLLREDVAGLTVSEAKEKIIFHLRQYLDDRQVGLIEFSASEPNDVTPGGNN